MPVTPSCAFRAGQAVRVACALAISGPCLMCYPIGHNAVSQKISQDNRCRDSRMLKKMAEHLTNPLQKRLLAGCLSAALGVGLAASAIAGNAATQGEANVGARIGTAAAGQASVAPAS